MATIIYCTGFEYGLETPVVSGAGLIDEVTGTVQIQAVTKKSGDYALYINGASVAAAVIKYTSGTPTYYVTRIYFQLTGTPTEGRNLFTVNTAESQSFIASFGASGVLRVQVNSGSQVNGPTISADTWYRLELKCYCGATTGTLDWQVATGDGAATGYTQATGAITASTFAEFRLGDYYNAFGCDIYVDDVALSGTSGDYPLGVGSVVGLRPSADGSHNLGGVITDEDTGTTNLYSKLDENPWITTANDDLILQSGIEATKYAEVAFADTTKTTINGVMAVMQYTSASAATCTGQFRIIDDAAQSTTIYTGDMNAAAAAYKSAIVTPPAAGWSTTNVNSLIGRVGYSGDVTPNPYWLAIMLEVDGSGEVSGGPADFNLYMI